MKYLLSLLICLSASAQLPVIPYSLPPSGGDPILSIPGIYAYWNSVDLATNVAISSWTDRIQGFVFQQGTAGNKPTNSWGNGVFFDAGGTLHFLDISNNGLPMLTNATISSYSIAIALNWDGHDGFDHVVLSDTNAVNTTEGDFYYHEVSPSQDRPQIDERYSINTWAINVKMSSGKVDIFIPSLNNGSYTNNVSKTDNFPLMFTNLTRIGTDRTKTINWNGGVMAVAIFTNQLFTSSTVRTTIHNQWTNQFNYSP